MTAITGKELIMQAFRHKEVERVPWIPFAGVHAASLKGMTAEEILKDKNKLLEVLLEVNKLYAPDGQPVLFDLQVEAEILGCGLKWDKKAPPSVATHPLEIDKDLQLSVPEKTDGRIPMILETVRALKKEVGDSTALFGLICGPLTLALHLRGNSIFMDMFDEPEYVKKLIGFCVKVNKAFTDYYLEAGIDVLAVVDPLVSQISPDHFTEFLSAPASDLFSYIRQKGTLSAQFVCGDATKNIEVMCKTKPDALFVDENVDLVEAKKVTDRHHVTLGGNLPLTSVMLLGSQQDNMKCAVDTLGKMGKTNYVLAPGCDMPFDVPVENVIGIVKAVRDFENTKHLMESYVKEDLDIDIELPDYKNLQKPLVEVFTLDSATCAACGYMMAAANEAREKFGDAIDTVEYKFNTKENIARVQKMGIKNLPVLYINGEMKYSSLIPSRAELFGEIEKDMKQVAGRGHRKRCRIEKGLTAEQLCYKKIFRNTFKAGIKKDYLPR